MKISLISPAAIQSSNGNYTTASRWKKILQSLGHHVDLSQHYSGNDYDLMIALHAWRSADAIQTFKQLYSQRKLIVALTGTDAYQFINSHTETTLNSIKLADHIIGLHEKISDAIPVHYHQKLSIIFQTSALKPVRKKKRNNNFSVCMAGHLRSEKDSLRPAFAVRSLPKTSKIYISHYGKAHDKSWEYLARKESIKNKRYHWHGEVSQSLLRIKFSQSQVLVLPSLMEGGANIISEAITCKLPIISSYIDGSVGLLGENYLGYFEAGNEYQLQKLLRQCETNKSFYKTLIRQCLARQHLFSHAKEVASWKQVLALSNNS